MPTARIRWRRSTRCGEYVGPPGLIAGVTFRAAKAGDILMVYALGFGETNGRGAAGGYLAIQ